MSVERSESRDPEREAPSTEPSLTAGTGAASSGEDAPAAEGETASGLAENSAAAPISEPSAMQKADAVFAEERRQAEMATPPEASGREMTFTEHLEELRVRLTRSIIAVAVGFIACYGFAEQLFELLRRPLVDLLEPTGGTLIYTGLPEYFFTEMKLAAVAGLFVVSPYVFYQLWRFVAPGLYESERKWIVPIALCSALCFVVGALFGYFVVFPFGFRFFLGYATDFIKPMLSVSEYFSFATGMLFAFGLIFELPLFMLFLSILGVVTHKTLRKYRKYAILANFVVGAILTPPDVVSQMLMAVPLCLLYEVGILAAMLFGKKPKPTAAEPSPAPGA